MTPNHVKCKTEERQDNRHHDCPVANDEIEPEGECDDNGQLQDFPPRRRLDLERCKNLSAQDNEAKQDCLKWLTEELKGERLRKKTEYEADALDGRFSGLSQRSFRKAWKDAWKLPTTHKSWHKRGPIKSS